MNGSLMRLACLFGVVLASIVTGAKESSAQATHYALDANRMTYHPEHGYVPLAAGYGGYAPYAVGATPGMSAGAAMAGFGQAAEGVGQARVSTAQAQDIHQQAVTGYLQNVGLAQDTILAGAAKRDQATREWRAAEDAHIKEQVALYQKTLEQMSSAHRLTAEQFGVDRGVLHWPFILRGPQYADLRLKLDKLYAARTPEDSGENSSGFDPIQQACKQMQEIVKEEVKKGLSPTDFVTATHFISSVAYEARFPVKATK